MSVDVVGGVLLSAVGFLGAIFAVLKFIYKRGGDERELVKAVNENTAVTKDLTVGLREFKEHATASLHELSISHERLSARVDVVEERLRGK